jgi:hypothetical protein
MGNLKKSFNLGWYASRVMAVAVLMGTMACGTVEDGVTEPSESVGTQQQELAGQNGLTLNGLTLNGLTLNGLTLNGLTLNGLTLNGLGTASFAEWFSVNKAQNAMLMKYIVQCAVAEGQARSFLDQSSGTSYQWQGSLGLAPNWASGQPINEAEQQVISACLAAHVNKFGLHVSLSVLGRTAQGQPISYSAAELQAFPRREGCFFGNLFTGVRRGELSARLRSVDRAERLRVRVRPHGPHPELRELLHAGPLGAVLHAVQLQRPDVPPAHHAHQLGRDLLVR